MRRHRRTSEFKMPLDGFRRDLSAHLSSVDLRVITIDAQSRSVESTIDTAEVCVGTAVQTALRTDSLASERKSTSFNDLDCLQQDIIGEAALEMQITVLTLNCWGLWLASRRRSERMRYITLDMPHVSCNICTATSVGLVHLCTVNQAS